MTWYDQKKVNEMGFDSPEWFKTCKVLDDPNVSQEDKDKAWEKYKRNLFESMGIRKKVFNYFCIIVLNISSENIQFKHYQIFLKIVI